MSWTLRSILPADVISHIQDIRYTQYAKEKCKDIYIDWSFNHENNEKSIQSRYMSEKYPRKYHHWSRVGSTENEKVESDYLIYDVCAYHVNNAISLMTQIILSPEYEPTPRPRNGYSLQSDWDEIEEYFIFQCELVDREMERRKYIQDEIQLRKMEHVKFMLTHIV